MPDNSKWPEGRSAPQDRERAALSLSSSIRQRMRCPCGEWEFRDLHVSVSLSVAERHCPRCRRDMLLVYRGAAPVVVVPFGGRQGPRFEAALREAGLDACEIEMLLTVAAHLAAAG